MKINKFLFLFIVITTTLAKANSKSDTTFVDSTWNKISRYQAVYYKLDTKDPHDSNRLITRVYDMKGRLRNEIPILCLKEDDSKKIKKVWDGLCKQWYESGSIKFETEYSKNKFNGNSTYYWPDGKIMKKEMYNNGKLLEEECYNEKGEKTDCAHIQNRPHYPQGEEALFNFIRKNLHYPAEVQKNGIEGTVLIQFVVTKEGKIEKIKIKKSLSPIIDAEVCRVIALTSPWIPSYDCGVPINDVYTFPISFKLK